jgi:hypothetical protein
MPGPHVDNDCRTHAQWLGTLGLALILGGLLGFVATISTAEDVELQKEQQKAIANPVKTEVKLPPGVTPPKKDTTPATGSGSGSGSGSGEPPAPATPATPPAESTGSAAPAPSY